MAEASGSDEMTSQDKGPEGVSLRIVMLGLEDADKIILANMLLGKKTATASSQIPEETAGFKLGSGIKPETKHCQWDTVHRFGKRIEVTDAPYMCEIHMSEDLTRAELEKCVAVAAPGPNIFLFVIRVDHCLTEGEVDAYKRIKRQFSEDVGTFLIVVFTGLDRFEGRSLNEKNNILHREVKNYSKLLADVLVDAESRYIGVDTRTTPEEMDQQAKALISFMEELVKKNWGKQHWTKEAEKINGIVERMTMKMALQKELSYADANIIVKRGIIKGSISLWEKKKDPKPRERGSVSCLIS